MIELSARNQIPGAITAITGDSVTAEVVVEIGGGASIASVITRGSVERLGLKVGDRVFAVIKATDVMIGTSTPESGGNQ
jgi:molybdopterin-binding protein